MCLLLEDDILGFRCPECTRVGTNIGSGILVPLTKYSQVLFRHQTGQTMADLILLLIFCLLNNRKKSGLIGKIVFLMKIVLLNVFSL